MLNPGLSQVYTGTSPHINYAPLGLALRSCGRGLSTLMMGFLPGPFWEPLKRAASFLSPDLTVDGTVIDGMKAGVLPGADRIKAGFRKAENAVRDAGDQAPV